MRTSRTLAISLALSACLSNCGNSSKSSLQLPAGAATATGYTLSVFIKAPLTTEKPDSIIQVGTALFIGYQNAGDVKDGSVPGLMNEVVQYDLTTNPPKLLNTFNVPGHVD